MGEREGAETGKKRNFTGVSLEISAGRRLPLNSPVITERRRR